eukprot:TRINITY_DN4344_c0_g1_i1.p1 TRINITY_DN4344_c0_g1~~TRINITY_DN4344_c0_g1_i1.p1  ORF type:complete len:284 (+),score=90.26 TRINITY_DN4344_c0_g1_i1:166-1017(+)
MGSNSMDGQSKKNTATDDIPGDHPVMVYTQQLLEEKEQQLRKYIQENYSKIRDVERELANLTLELKLTAGPKKAALEHLRKKIELSTEKIRAAKEKEEQARKVWEAADKALKDEEANKQRLCDDLNRLVQESASSQYSRLEELKRRLEALSSTASGSPNDLAASKTNGLSLPSSSDSNMNPAMSNQQGKMITGDTAVSGSASTTEKPSESRAGQNADKQGADKSHNSVSGASTRQMGEGIHFSTTKGGGSNINRARGNLILPRPKGGTGGGWTGSGFDVDPKG